MTTTQSAIKYFDSRALLDELTARCEASSQTILARELGISVSYLGDVLHGRRGISDRMARALGYERLTVYRRKEPS